MKLSNKIFLSFFGIIIFSVLLSSLTGSLLIFKELKSEAISRVSNDLKSVKRLLEDKLGELQIASQLVAKGIEAEVKLPFKPSLSLKLNKTGINSYQKRFYNYLKHSIGEVESKPEKGFIKIPVDILKEIGFNLSLLPPKTMCDKKETLWLFATTPAEKGFSFSGLLLNGNTDIITELQNVHFGHYFYHNKPFGTVTIFCGDVRVATTVIGPDGKIAYGTRVSDVVRKRVLEEGGMWIAKAFVVDDWYLSAYGPIKSPRGDIIGILYVGVLEQKYVDIGKRVMLMLTAIMLPALGLLILGVFLISRSIVKPITQLANASRKIAGGNLDTKVKAFGNTAEIKTLEDSFNQMVEAIKKREEMLIEKNKELEEANKNYQELLSFVTHELNNSIGSLLLNVSILNDGTVGELSEEQKEVAQLILHDVERFRDMVRNYLNISRLEKGTLKYNPVIIDIKEKVVKPVVTRLESRIKSKGIRIEWDWPENTMANADPELMDIVFSNLIVNAIKYGKDWIRFKAKRDGDYWIFGVENGGKGIPQDKIPLLFKKFSRLVKSDDGAGLGLYLVKQIIKRHGGEVWCESEENVKTGFYIKLKAAN